jgi:4-amino-4-deoxychorismate lyase
MCRLIETIKIFKREVFNIDYHNQRLNNSRKILFGCKDEIELINYIHIPDALNDGLYKCRIVYGKYIESFEFIYYPQKHLKTLKLVQCDQISYDHKFQDRRQIDELYQQRGSCDDVLIIKNGRLTDTSFCNIALFDGTSWYTPDTPLLRGTKREKLLDEGRIKQKSIKGRDLKKYKKLCVFNAMIEFGDMVIPVDCIS